MIFIAGINIQAIGPLLTNAANNCGSVFVWVKKRILCCLCLYDPRRRVGIKYCF
jgi:hypothetical protein